MSLTRRRIQSARSAQARPSRICALGRGVEALEPRLVLDSTVVFNEIMYHPAGDNPADEWIELHNQMSINMDLSDWELRGGVDYDFPIGTVIPAGGYLVIAAAGSTIPGALGPFTGRLNNGGEEIRLQNNNDRVMDLVAYGDTGDWPAAADGGGVSLAKRDRNQASGPVENWTFSPTLGGTPGSDNFPAFDSTPVSSTLVDRFDTWNYNDSGADLGTAWVAPSFDDSTWDTGEASFFDDPPTPGGSPATPSLVAHWTFDDTTDDVAGPNDGGVLNGGATYSTTVPTPLGSGKSLALNGTTSYFSVAPLGTLNGSYTVSMWARRANTTLSTMFATRSPSDFGFDARLSNLSPAVGRAVANIGNGTSAIVTNGSGTFANAVNAWNHFVYVVRPNGYKIFVDGVQRISATFATNNPLLWDPNHVVNIGRNNLGAGGEYLNGFIDDVAVWSNALDAAQITRLFAGDAPETVGPGHDGALRYLPITNDADSGISAEKTYTHKLDFGNGPVATVNGVTFDTNFVPGTGSTTIPQTFASDGSHNTGGNVSNLFTDFIYNNAEAKITLSNLTVGQAYDLRLYVRQWGSVFDRSQILEFDTDNDGGADRTVRLNPDDATSAAPDLDASNRAYAVSYVYVAKSADAVVRITQTGAGTYHLYGLTNELTDFRPINTLYSTGISEGGGRLVQGTPDPHYMLLPGAAQGTTAVAVTNHPAWATNDAGSGFISVAEPGATSIAGGSYNYETEFDLAGFDPATAEITMTLWADDSVTDVLINGVSTGITFGGFTHADGRTFKITSGFAFGVNRIEFRTVNAGAGAGGFRADLSGVAKLMGSQPQSTAIVTADDHFAVYVGNADGSNLRLVGRDTVTDWTTTQTFGYVAAPGEHLFVVAWDNPPGTANQQMWIGRFVGPDGETIHSNAAAWEFRQGPADSNPGNNLLTNSLPTLASLQAQIAAGGFATVGASAANNAAPWGTNAGITSGFAGTPAQFLWSDTLANTSSADTSNAYVLFRSKEPLVPVVKRTPLAEGLTTYYFRNEFDFTDDPSRTVLSLVPTIDDGAVFYLNGVEIYRQNMPAGAITSSTPASSEVFGEPLPQNPIVVPSAALVSGRNVLAVELHRAVGSPDLQFDAKLIAAVSPLNPDTLPSIVINELPGATEGTFFVELANEGAATVDIGGFIIARISPEPLEFALPAGTLAPGAKISFTQAQLGFNAADGDRIVLYMPGKGAVLDGRQLTNRLRGRSTQHDGAWLYPQTATPGAENVFSFHDEIVINEIMYHHRPTPAQPLIEENSTLVQIQANWQYNQSGADLGTAWREPAYVPTGWGTGAGILYAGPLSGGANPSRVAIPTLFSTGKDANNVVLPNEGQVDPHYTIVAAPVGIYDGPEAFIAESDGFPIPPWAANDGQSKWISARAQPGTNDDSILPVGTFVYRTTFDLSGFLPSSAILTLSVGADNALNDVLINGQSTGISYVGFNALSGQFTISSGFVPGINTIDFVTENYPSGDNPAAFRAVLSGTALPVPKNTELALGPTTYYFRNQFNFEGDPAKTTLRLLPLADDGAVYYLNGVEVYRQNMPAGSITSSTLAAANIPGEGTFASIVSIPAANLANGVNTLAVEVHQAAGGFDDMVFGAEIYATETIQEATEFDESPEEWIEFFNKSDHPVDVSGWRIKGGVDYTFPQQTSIPAGGYLVVSDNAAYLSSLHPGITVLGNYGGTLSNNSDRILLEDAAENPVDDVKYYDSGKWHGAADGGGSSLELRDPDADNSNAAAWAPSREEDRSAWQTITYRAVASNTPGANPTQWHEFVLGLLDSGEFLLDDVSVREDPDGANTQLIQNGSFTTGANAWRILGTHGIHGQTVVIPEPGNPANNVLRVVASGPTEHMHNHLETTYANGQTVEDGKTYEISLRVKWISGSNQLNTRLYFNRAPRTTLIDIPDLSGTPGAANSQLAAGPAHNIGPVYEDFRHGPVTPAAAQPVTVNVTAADPDGVAAMTLWWRVESGAWQSGAMSPTGDGNFTAQIPGQAAATIVQFYVEGRDALNATSTYPAAGANSRALYKVADGQAQLGNLHNFRIIMLTADADLMHTPTNVMSNHRLGGTVVYDEGLPYYDVGIRLQGSERGRNDSGRVSFDVAFQPDQLFRGVHPAVATDRSGGYSGRGGKQDEIIFWQMANRAGDIPAMYNDLVHMIAPRTVHNGSAMLTLAEYEDEYLDTQYENGSDGGLFKYELIYFPTSTNTGGPEGLKLPQPDGVNGVALRSLGDNKESYRWNFLLRNNRDADDYSGLMQFLKTMDLTGPAFLEQAEVRLDVDEWLRSIAMGVLANVGDSWVTGGLGHNAYFYQRPEDGRWLYFPWDNDFAWIGNSTDSVGGDRNGDLNKLLTGSPKNVHYYYGHMHDIVTTAFNASYVNTWTTHLGQKAGQNYAGVASFINDRSNHALTAINAAVPQVAFSITTNGGANFTTPDVVATLSGNGWVNVREIRIAGRSDPLNLTWTTASAWRTSVPLAFGANALTLEAYDFQGNLITTDTITITSTTSDRPVQEFLRITELMYHPGDPSDAELAAGFNDADDFEYIEFYNRSLTETLNLTGVTISGGVDFNFTDAAITTLAPGGYLLVVENIGAMTARYGAGLPIAGQYSGQLNNAGESLLVLDSNSAIVHDFTYDDSDDTGWHSVTDGDGPSLVIVNPLAAAATWNDGVSWRPSFAVNGSPGSADRLVGDANSDNRVDLVDLAIVQASLGTASGATWATGDFNGDGAVTRTDAALLSRNYGRSYTPPGGSPPSAAAAVVTRAARRPAPAAEPRDTTKSLTAIVAERARNGSQVDRAISAVASELGSDGVVGATRLRARRVAR